MEKKFLKKIIAQSSEDLQIISACCSEAKIKLGDITWDHDTGITRLIELVKL